MEETHRWIRQCRRLPDSFMAFLVAGFLAAIGRNGYLLGATWVLASGSHGAHSVALFLLIASLSELAASVFAGLIVDRYDRRLVFSVAEMLRFAAVFLTGIFFAETHSPDIFYLSVVVFSVSDRAASTAYQALLPLSSSPVPIVTANSIGFFTLQAGSLAAALVSGGLLSLCQTSVLFMLLSIFSAGSALVMRSNVRGRPLVLSPMSMKDFGAGIDSMLLILAADYALLYGSGVLVSVMGATFILHDMKGSSTDFGAMEACWSFGSICGSMLALIGSTRFDLERLRLATLLLVAVASVSLSFVTAPAHLLVFAVIGASYNMGRVLVEAALHRHLPCAAQGRARGLLHSTAMMLAIAIFSGCANLKEGLPAADLFALYGGIVIIAASGIHLVMRAK